MFGADGTTPLMFRKGAGVGGVIGEDENGIVSQQGQAADPLRS